jgi:WD40 repeat protein
VRTPIGLVKFVAKAAINAAGFGVAGDFAIDVLPEMARDVWAWWGKDRSDAERRADLEALAHMPAGAIRREAEAAVAAVAAAMPPPIQKALTAYLTQLPGNIRQSLRRPSDPSGTTVPPGLALNAAENLLPFLPARLPRFKAGDRPLPGVDWVLEELVGVGGFGEVWKARHAHLQSKAPVALKFCLDAAAVPVLRNEAGVLDRVMRHGRHAGIVPLLQTYLSAEPPCLEYEFIEGGDLAGLAREWHAHGKMTPERASRLLLDLAEIVAFAHAARPPIVHGDLKPANVLVRRAAGGEVALWVTDFGIGGLAVARAAEDATRSRQELLTEAVRGAYTPLYASPEQMARRRGEPADPRDDVHALGVIWYQLVTSDLGMVRIPPDWRERVQELGLGEGLVRLQAACIASRADQRPANATVLAEQLRATLRVPARSTAPEAPLAVPAPAEGTAVVRAPAKPAAATLAVRLFRMLLGVAAIGVFCILLAGVFRLVMKSVTVQERTDQQRATLKGHTGSVSSVCFSADDKTLASGSEDRTIKLWDVASAQERATLKGHTGGVRSVCFSADGKILASGSEDRTIKLWDVASAQERVTLKGHTGKVGSVCFSPNRKTLASAGFDDDTVKLWDVETGQERLSLRQHIGFVWSVCFSFDGKILASGGGGALDPGIIKLWDVATGQEQLSLKGHTKWVTSVAFSSDGKTLASSSGAHGEIKLWEVETGQERLALQGQRGQVLSVCFSPDGKTLASASSDLGGIKLWDVQTGQERLTLKGHDCRFVCFSSDGQTLASASGDEVKLWSLH